MLRVKGPIPVDVDVMSKLVSNPISRPSVLPESEVKRLEEIFLCILRLKGLVRIQVRISPFPGISKAMHCVDIRT